MKKTPIHIFLVSALFMICSCKKDSPAADTKSLILGKWIGVNKITKNTTQNPSTLTYNYFSDTLYESSTGSAFSIEFKADRLNTTGNYISGNSSSVINVSHYNLPYAIHNDSLSFMISPFTLEGLINNTNHISTKILQLTTGKLVLYDMDTIQPSPLVLHESWFSFKR